MQKQNIWIKCQTSMQYLLLTVLVTFKKYYLKFRLTLDCFSFNSDIKNIFGQHFEHMLENVDLLVFTQQYI